MSVRVRFAPSPTGLLHVGALRTVLFDQLLAKKHEGQLILRIEDTDRSRYNADSEKEFVETLHWVGIDFDEGPHVGGPHFPYRQSERQAEGIYATHIETLLNNGSAYKAFDTPEELEAMREQQLAAKQATGYFGGHWRDASADQVAQAEAEGKPYVIRQRIPRGQTIVMQDAIRGQIEWNSDLLPDPVLIKTDGMPTYHFAAMVDDHLMGITHVLRGDEWLPSFPLHWLLFDAFGWERPIFVHCSVIVGKDGKKLSKRHGATRVLDYSAQGYLKEALKNFIALIGWSPGEDREVMSESEMVERFSVDGLQASPGFFDIEKLKWLNGVRIREKSASELVDDLVAYITDDYTRQYWQNFVDEPMPNQVPINGIDVLKKLDAIVAKASQNRNYLEAAVEELKPRVTTLADFGDGLEFFLVEEPPMDTKAVEKWFKQAHVSGMFSDLIQLVESTNPTKLEEYESLVKTYAETKGFEKLGPVVHPIRVAMTGKTAGPGLFELMSVLGKDKVIARFRKALELAS